MICVSCLDDRLLGGHNASGQRTQFMLECLADLDERLGRTPLLRVRRYVPELRAVPDEYLSEPWTMPEEVQRDCGCVIGEDYPEPIVEHREAPREAFERYAVGG